MRNDRDRPSVSRRSVVIASITGLGAAHLLAACAPVPSSQGSRHSPGSARGVARLTADNRASVSRRRAPVGYAPGMAIELGDDIETDASNHALIEFDNGDAVYMSPATRVRIGSIFVYFGEIFAKIVSGQGTFRADSDVVSAGVERTEFLMRVDRQTRQTTVTVRSGVVRCSPATRALPPRGGDPIKTDKPQRWTPQRVDADQQITVAPGVSTQPKPVVLQRAQVVSATQWVERAAPRLTIKRPPVKRPPVKRPPARRPPVERPPVERPPITRPPITEDDRTQPAPSPVTPVPR
jgi:hypothetical protein